MKKIFLGLGLASLALLAACGGKKDDNKDDNKEERTKVQAKTDDTDLTKYTETTGDAIYSSVNKTKKYNYTSIDASFILKIDGRSSSLIGTMAFEYSSLTNKWGIDLLATTSGFASQEDNVKSYTFGNFDGLYYTYNQLTSFFTVDGYETVNWYTKNDGGYRVVALDNEDYSAVSAVFEWDKDGYMKFANLLADITTEENIKQEKANSVSYTFSNKE